MKFKPNRITEEEKEAIINYFKTEKNNTMPVMAEKFGFSGYIIGKVVTEYYSTKKQNK
tara:strand:- start:6227 stop:6400 length:174 start_codon:yes stop_codon:yes gene_type:complete